MRFGDRVRELWLAKRWRLRDLSEKISVGFTHYSTSRNERLNSGDYLSAALSIAQAEFDQHLPDVVVGSLIGRCREC